METKKQYTNFQIAALADEFGRSPSTIIRWIESANPMLTSDKAKKVLLAVEFFMTHLKNSPKC